MKLKILDTTGKQVKEMELPEQFSEPVRLDLIKKAVLAIQNNSRQAYGGYETAGKRHSTFVSKKRREYRGVYGKGMSRAPRKIMSRKGSQLSWTGAMAPGTRGGRKAHPPKAFKNWEWKLNEKEKRKAIRSAMSATLIRDLVEKRGHKVPANYPFIITDDFEKTTRTKDLIEILNRLGFEQELIRGANTGIRAGKGKLRGRRKTTKKSILFVVTENDSIMRAAKNIPGVETVNVNRINAEILAPGGHAGRACLYTAKAVEAISKGMFTKNYKGVSPKKENAQ